MLCFYSHFANDGSQTFNSSQGVHYKALVNAQQLEQTIAHDSEVLDSTNEEMTKAALALSSADTSLEKIPSRYSPMQHKDGALIRSDVSNLTIIKRSLTYLKPERWLLIIGTLAAVIQGAVVVGEAIVFGHLINILNTVQERNLFYDRIDLFCLMFFVISLVALSASAISGTCFGFVSEAFVLRMRDILLRTILIQDQSWFQEPEHTTTKLMASMNQNSNSIAAVSGPILQTLFATSSMIISGMILAFISTPLVTVVALTYVPAIMLSGYVRVKMLTLFNVRHASANKDAAAIACEAVQSIQTVAAFSLQKDILFKYNQALRSSYQSNFVVMAIGNLALSFSYSIIYFLYPLL